MVISFIRKCGNLVMKSLLHISIFNCKYFQSSYIQIKQLHMIIGERTQNQKGKGKRTSGFTTKKEGQFSLGWDVNNKLNDFQIKKQQKEQNGAYKVTQKRTSQNIPLRSNQEPRTIEEKCRELLAENPYMTHQQLDERIALWQLRNNQPTNKQAPRAQSKPHSQKPVDSAKNVIYGGEQKNNTRTQIKGSRRNEGTFSLGDGYNYFKDQNNGK